MLAHKLEQVCAEYHAAVQDLPEPYDELLKRLLALLADFPSAPFTVQRLCEVRRLRHSLTRMTGHAGRLTLTSPVAASLTVTSLVSALRPQLLLDPHRIYATSTRKVTSAVEKLLTVSSTVPTMVSTTHAPTPHTPLTPRVPPPTSAHTHAWLLAWRLLAGVERA